MKAAGTPYVLLTGTDGEQEVSLADRYLWRIGRSERSDILVADKRVSRDHAVIQQTDGGDYYLIDMGSRNGSFVNEKRVSIPVALKDGDRLSIGGYEAIFRWPDMGHESVERRLTGSDVTQDWFVSRLLTVLVVDVRDFTGLAQRVPQDVLSQTIGTWFRLATEIMTPRGSWSLNYIGDAVMSIWLHEDRETQHSQLLEVMRSVVELASATACLESKFGLPVQIRIGAGINTGMASVGNTGAHGLTNFTALGETVNSAFRIESATKEVGADVAVGDGTFKALQRRAWPEAYFQRHEVRLKGYEAPALVWAASLDALRAFLDDSAL